MKIGLLEKTAEERVSHTEEIKKRVMIKNFEVPHITQFAQARFPPRKVAEEHSHEDMYEIFFVEKGEGKIRINGTDYPLKEGSYVVIEPGETHEVTSNGELILMYFGVRV